MNCKYLKGILPHFTVLFMALSLIACGSGGSGSRSGSSDAGIETEPITSEDICNSDTEQKDIIFLQANSVKIHWDDYHEFDLHYGYNSHNYDDCKDDNKCDSNDRDHDCDDDNKCDDDCDHGKENDLVKVKIKGELALKCTDYTQLDPLITAGISISSQEVINESMEFQVSDSVSMWEYKNNAVYTGINKFKISWKGPGFDYDGDINIKATSIGYDKTIMKIDPKSIKAAFSVDIGAATIQVDENGFVNAYPDSYASLKGISDDGTIIVELLFELSKDMSIFIHQSNKISEIHVAPYYLASRGEFRIKGYFDPAGLENIMQSADFDLRVIVGNIELTGSSNIADIEWDKSDRTWRYPSLD